MKKLSLVLLMLGIILGQVSCSIHPGYYSRGSVASVNPHDNGKDLLTKHMQAQKKEECMKSCIKTAEAWCAQPNHKCKETHEAWCMKHSKC